ncbi:hypothetical protein D5125_10110 [Magnetovirga frankeli]|uniref:hypothetical protein n=1 Tax=Magnetovirga frankeli TaxID=947516 RepID=UPI001292D38B|nr:hypothetical protein D5125_10110 [gamma proteobacterium SS-5]
MTESNQGGAKPARVAQARRNTPARTARAETQPAPDGSAQIKSRGKAQMPGQAKSASATRAQAKASKATDTSPPVAAFAPRCRVWPD